MATKMGEKKTAPQFFIPATYKGPHVGLKGPSGSPSQKHIPTTDPIPKPDMNAVDTSPRANQMAEVNRHEGTSSYLYASPGGMLDLSHYNYAPMTLKSNQKSNGMAGPPLAMTDQTVGVDNPATAIDSKDGAGGGTVVEKEKKRRRFRRPRRNSKLDRIIRFLEDKRVGDDDNGEDLEDLQMPRLRKVLNIIFVTLGVCFLLAVIIVILYTTIATDTDALIEACSHRFKDAEPCDNHSKTSQSSKSKLSSSTTTTTESTSSMSMPPSSTPSPSSAYLPPGPSPPNRNFGYPPNPTYPYGPIANPQHPISNPTESDQFRSPPDVSIDQIGHTTQPLANGGGAQVPPNYPVYTDGQGGQYYSPNRGNYPWSYQPYQTGPDAIAQPSESKRWQPAAPKPTWWPSRVAKVKKQAVN